jgi:hypothetical protein
MPGLGLINAEHVLVEFGGLLQVLDLERDVDNASYGSLPGTGYHQG